MSEDNVLPQMIHSFLLGKQSSDQAASGGRLLCLVDLDGVTTVGRFETESVLRLKLPTMTTYRYV